MLYLIQIPGILVLVLEIFSAASLFKSEINKGMGSVAFWSPLRIWCCNSSRMSILLFDTAQIHGYIKGGEIAAGTTDGGSVYHLCTSDEAANEAIDEKCHFGLHEPPSDRQPWEMPVRFWWKLLMNWRFERLVSLPTRLPGNVPCQTLLLCIVEQEQRVQEHWSSLGGWLSLRRTIIITQNASFKSQYTS